VPDSITPVGTMYAQQNPIAALSSIYGLQQQQLDIARGKQALQTGQYAQQSAQAQSQQDQQKNAELQGLATFSRAAAKDPRYILPDGSLDTQKFIQGAQAVAPVYGPEHFNQIVSGAKEAVQTRSAVQALSNDQNTQLGNGLMGIATKKDSTWSDVLDWAAQERANNPNPDFSRALDNIIGSVDKNDIAGWAQKAVGRLKGMATQTPSTIDTGGQVQPGATNQFSGAFTPAGSPIQKTLAPAQQIPYVAAAAAASSGGTARGGGSGNADIDASNNVVAAQRDARTNIDLTTRIDQLADIVAPGALPAKVSQGLGALGLTDVNQARTELQKDLGRLRGGLAGRAGSDSRAAELLTGLPTDTTPTPTIHQAMDVTRGTAKQDLALGQLQQQNSKATGGQMTGFQSQYAHATSAASPLMHEYWSLPKPQQAQFLKRNSSSPQQAQELRNRFEAARSQLNVGQ